VQGRLRKDVLQRMASAHISDCEYQSLFEEHVAMLLTAARKQYTAALEEAVKPALTDAQGELRPPDARGELARDWQAASEVLAAYPCFHKIHAQERHARWQVFVGEAGATPAAECGIRSVRHVECTRAIALLCAPTALCITVRCRACGCNGASRNSGQSTGQGAKDSVRAGAEQDWTRTWCCTGG
jgi:hypothetical protein